MMTTTASTGKGVDRMAAVCDKSCIGCRYLANLNGCTKYCSFYLDTGIRRPCPAGEGCTVRNKKNVMTMKQVIDAQASSYLARLAREKKDESQLGQDMGQCEKEGDGARYGAWKATQPVVEIVKEEDKRLRVCPYCGEKFKPRAVNSKYCCTDHAVYAYNIRKRARQRKAAD